MLKTYDPKAHSFIVGGRPITGWAEDFLEVERNEDAWTLMTGASGESTRAKNANKSGRFRITLLASSEDNDYLMGLLLADETTGNGTVPVYHKDNRGTTLNTAATAWIVKSPTQGFGKDGGTRTWELETDELIHFAGGNT